MLDVDDDDDDVPHDSVTLGLEHGYVLLQSVHESLQDLSAILVVSDNHYAAGLLRGVVANVATQCNVLGEIMMVLLQMTEEELVSNAAEFIALSQAKALGEVSD